VGGEAIAARKKNALIVDRIHRAGNFLPFPGLKNESHPLEKEADVYRLVRDSGHPGSKFLVPNRFAENKTHGIASLKMPHYQKQWPDLQQELPETIFQAAVDLAAGVEAIHRVGLVHNDVKPQNIFLTSSFSPRIGDLGMVSAIDDKLSLRGTMDYLPLDQTLERTVPTGDLASHTPEQIFKMGTHRDVYGLLASLSEVLAPHSDLPKDLSYEYVCPSPNGGRFQVGLKYSPATIKRMAKSKYDEFHAQFGPTRGSDSDRIYSMLSSLSHAKGGIYNLEQVQSLLAAMPAASRSDEAMDRWYSTLYGALLRNSSGVTNQGQRSPIFFGLAELGVVVFTDIELASRLSKMENSTMIALLRRRAEQFVGTERDIYQDYDYSKYGSPYLLDLPKPL